MTMKERPQELKLSAVLVQSGAVFAVAFLTTLTGFVFAWPSYSLERLTAADGPLTRPLSSAEAALVGSLPSAGALLATPLCAPLCSRLGRRGSAMLFGVPYVAAWAMLLLSPQVWVVLLAMFLVGCGTAGQVVCSVFVAEVASPAIRGALATSVVYMYFVGLLASYVWGGQLPYRGVLYVHLGLSALYVLMVACLKETPVQLMRRGKEKEAAESLAFYRRVPATSKEVEVELNRIRMLLDPNIDQLLQQGIGAEVEKELLPMPTEKKDPEPIDTEKVSSWRFLMRSGSSKRALAAVLMTMTLSTLMGAIVLQVYAEPLFARAVPGLSPNLCAILIAADFLLASLISSSMTDKFGRKPLNVWSSLLSGVCCSLLGAQLLWEPLGAWATVALLLLYGLVFTTGAGATPFVLMAEVFLPEVSGLCNAISLGCMWLMAFLALVTFIPLVEAVGLGPVFFMFALVSFVSCGYGAYLVPETKGLPVEQIQLLFYKRSAATRTRK